MSLIYVVRDWMYSLMRIIDNGKFFIKPQKWLYFINGLLAFVTPLIVTYLIIDNLDSIIGYTYSGWTKFVAYLGISLFCIFMYVMAFVIFYFWKSRINNVDAHVKVGDNIVALPLMAHAWKSLGEALGLYIGVLPPVGAVFFYFFSLLTGANGFYHNGNFLSFLIVCILLTAACILIAWFIVFIFRSISEYITILPQIANDVRDLGDIHRAAVIPEETNNSEEL